MNWIVQVHDGAARQLKAIPPDRRQRVMDDIAAFEVDPIRGLVKPLKGKDHKGHAQEQFVRMYDFGIPEAKMEIPV